MTHSVTSKKAKIACTDPSAQGYALFIDYGDKACGDILGCSPGIARNKLNPDIETNKLSLDEAVKLSQVLDDDRQLAAWAASRGKALIDLPQGSVSDDELTDQILQLSEELGNQAKEIREARKDGVIEPDEYKLIQQRTHTLLRCVLNLDAEIASQVRTLPTKIRSV
jgi:hypothetical protein